MTTALGALTKLNGWSGTAYGDDVDCLHFVCHWYDGRPGEHAAVVLLEILAGVLSDLTEHDWCTVRTTPDESHESFFIFLDGSRSLTSRRYPLHPFRADNLRALYTLV